MEYATDEDKKGASPPLHKRRDSRTETRPPLLTGRIKKTDPRNVKEKKLLPSNIKQRKTESGHSSFNSTDSLINIKSLYLSSLSHFRDDNSDNPTRVILNDYMNTVLEKNRKAFITYFGGDNVPSFETAYITLVPPTQNNALSSSWENHTLFLDVLDDKLFMHYVPQARRSTEWWCETLSGCWWAGWFGLAPFAIMPVSLSSGAVVFNKFLPQNFLGEEVAYTFAGCMVPSCTRQGWNFSKKQRNVMDPQGLTPGHSRIPHVLEFPSPKSSLSTALATGVVRTAPLLVFLWIKEMRAARILDSYEPLFWAAGFTISYVLHGGERVVTEFLDSIRRSNNKKQTEAIHMMSEKKKLLKHSIAQLHFLVNGDESDALVLKLDNEFNEIIAGKTLRRELKESLKSQQSLDENKEKIVKSLYTYLQFKIQGKRISSFYEEQLKNQIKQKISSLDSLNNLTAEQIHTKINILIETKILENDLNKNINSPEKCIDLIYRYIQDALGRARPSPNLKKKILERVNPLFGQEQEEGDKQIQALLKIPQDILNGNRYSKMKHKFFFKSAASLLFVKYIYSIQYDEKINDVVKKANKLSTSHTEPTGSTEHPQRPTESTELLDAVELLKNVPVDGVAKFIYDQNNLPPEPHMLERLRTFSHNVLGAAIPGRFLVTSFPLIATNVFGATVSKWVSLGLGGSDIGLRHVQERYVQEDFYTNLYYFGSRYNDFWPIRWAAKGLAAVCSLPIPTAVAGIIFEMMPGAPDYIKYVIAALTVTAEFSREFEFFDTHLQEGITDLVTCPLPQRIEDLLPQWLKVKRARARLNKRFNRMFKEIDSFDQDTTEQWYYLVTNTI